MKSTFPLFYWKRISNCVNVKFLYSRYDFEMIPLLFRVYFNSRKMEGNEVGFTLSWIILYTFKSYRRFFSFQWGFIMARRMSIQKKVKRN